MPKKNASIRVNAASIAAIREREREVERERKK